MLYKRIRELREDNDKTQRELADYLGTSYQYYAVYEKGTSEISFERAIQLADYYNVSLDYIAERSNIRNIDKGEAYGEDNELLGMLGSLCERDKRLIRKMMEAMLSDDKK